MAFNKIVHTNAQFLLTIGGYALAVLGLFVVFFGIGKMVFDSNVAHADAVDPIIYPDPGSSDGGSGGDS